VQKEGFETESWFVVIVKTTEGKNIVGWRVGNAVGLFVGKYEGLTVGRRVGRVVGIAEIVGSPLGRSDGTCVGDKEIVGARVGEGCIETLTLAEQLAEP
jgi:hypothetical protein